ncbi:zinc finger protein 99-like [Culicoides brevitarsis]|uniref:zinc finger protein 99-like n=1 Tax=Culicoides brevitarsis TaxID=469753 RepID=UPI00307C1C4F
MSETINIFLEFDASDGYIFSVLSEENLKRRIVRSKERILVVKENPAVPKTNVRVYCEVRRMPLPLESIFLNEDPVITEDIKPEFPEELELGEIPKLPSCLTVKIKPLEVSKPLEPKRGPIILTKVKSLKNAPPPSFLKDLQIKLPRIDQVFSLKNSSLSLEAPKNVEKPPVFEVPTPVIIKSTPEKPNNKKFSCPNCPMFFTTKHALMTHTARKTCFVRMLNGEKKMVRRVKEYIPPDLVLPDLNTIPCPYEKSFLQPDGTTAYVYHVSESSLRISNFDLQNFVCGICGENSRDSKNLLMHRLQQHFFPGNKRTCNGCEKYVETHKERRDHVLYCLKHTEIDPNKCYICNSVFAELTSLKVHLYQEHPYQNDPVEYTFECKICNKFFKSRDNRKSHIRRVHQKYKEPRVYCAHCPYEARNKKTLYNHLITRHFPNLAAEICEVCRPTRYFVSNSKYVQHMSAMHRGLKFNPDTTLEALRKQNMKIIQRKPLRMQKYRFEDVRVPKRADNFYVEDMEIIEELPVLEPKVAEKAPEEEEKGNNYMKVELIPSDSTKITKNLTKFDLQLNRKSTLDYLPEGVLIPSNFKTFKHPIHVSVDQPDGTTVYIYQSSETSILFISNFDLRCNRCELCGQDFSNGFYTSFIKHRQNFHFFPGDREECVACGKSFDSADKRQRHSLFCTEKDKMDIGLCYICNIQYDDFYMYRQHLMAMHPRLSHGAKSNMRTCPICSKTVSANVIRDHMRRHDNPKPYKCNECGNVYAIKRSLRNHLLEVHFQDLCSHKCEECNPVRYFEMLSAYLTHRKNMHNLMVDPKNVLRKQPERKKCPKCGKHVVCLQDHLQTHADAEAMFVTNQGKSCEICGKLFKKTSSLMNHKKSHLPEHERPFKCAHCAKGFNSMAAVTEHERLHTGEKPLVCPFCQKAFARQQTYTDHVKTHTGQGYKCEHCDRVLNDHSSFRKHLKVHEKELGIKLTYTKDERRWKDMGLYEKAKDFI